MAKETVPSGPQLPLARRNFLIIGVGIALLVLGFVLMASEPFIDATQFSLALHVAPVVILVGYGVIGYGIMAKAK